MHGGGSRGEHPTPCKKGGRIVRAGEMSGGMSRRGMSGSRKNNASSARYQTFIFGRIVHVRLNVQLIGFGCGLILSVRSNGWMCIV